MSDKVIDNIVTQYSTSIMDTDLNLIYIEDLLTDGECDHLVGLAYDSLFKRSLTTDGTTEGISAVRTSHTASLSSDKITNAIKERIARLCNTKLDKVEELQIVKYEIGQEFELHHDYFPPDYVKKYNYQRHYTFFVYLNTVDKGGETYFASPQLEFSPKKGHSIFWENCKSINKPNERSLHQGKKPLSDIKFGLNIWIHF